MRLKFALLSVLFLLAPLVWGTQLSGQKNFNKVVLASVYDGDTFRVNLSCRYGLFCQSIPVRVRGVDCPEIRGAGTQTRALAKRARAFTKEFLSGGKILLRNCGRDKYFRILCDVKVGGRDLGSELLKSGLAIPYDGGEKNAPIQR